MTAPKPDKDTRIISLSLPQTALKEIDRTVGDVGYPSRSELVRDAVRAFLREKKEVSALSGHINGIMLLIYDHGCAAQVSEARHRQMGIFKSFMHADFDEGEDCCEVLMFCGEAEKVRESYFQLTALVGVREARIFLA